MRLFSYPIYSISLFCFILVITVDRSSWVLNGGRFAPNCTYFNFNDYVAVRGYIRSITVQYDQGRLPSSSARIWIYGIVPIVSGFKTCSKYAVPSSQISTSRVIQTYTLPNNIINVLNGAYIGIGIQDTSAYLATTTSGWAANTGNANLSTNATFTFRSESSRYGFKLSYTVVT